MLSILELSYYWSHKLLLLGIVQQFTFTSNPHSLHLNEETVYSATHQDIQGTNCLPYIEVLKLFTLMKTQKTGYCPYYLQGTDCLPSYSPIFLTVAPCTAVIKHLYYFMMFVMEHLQPDCMDLSRNVEVILIIIIIMSPYSFVYTQTLMYVM